MDVAAARGLGDEVLLGARLLHLDQRGGAVEVEDLEAAERERFLGSPTVRIDGQDVEPGADRRTDFGLKCRLFATPDGLRGMPTDEWVLATLQRAPAPSS